MVKGQQLTQRVTRPGEGVAMGVVHTKNIGTSELQALTIDISSAQVPERRYAAEVGAIIMSDNMVRLLFGQTKPIGTGLNSLLVIHIPYRAAITFRKSMSELVVGAREYMARFKVGNSTLLDLKSQTEPAQTATVESNIIIAAFSGREACMDFYHTSPFAIKGVGLTGKFFAEPTVRVTLGLPLMMAIYDWLETHKKDMPADEMENEL